MSNTIRVALPSYNAETDTNPDHFALYSDEDWVLIKEKTRGSSTVSASSSTNIAHGLSYIPMVLVFAEAADGDVGTAGKWYQVAGKDSNSLVGIEVTTINLILTNNASNAKNFKYYIFYDQQV